MLNKVLVVLYHFPEGYPPTLHAIQAIAKKTQQTHVLCRNINEAAWIFPTNVKVYRSGSFIQSEESHRLSAFSKLRFFLQFTRRLYKLLAPGAYDLVLLYDPIPLLSFTWIRNLLTRQPMVWYHNHDILEPGMLKNSRLNALAARAEQRGMEWIDFLSLPAKERVHYYSIGRLKGNLYIIPNYPSKSFFQSFYQLKNLETEEIRLLYQGFASPDHGLEAIIQHLLPWRSNGKAIRLLIKGRIKAGIFTFITCWRLFRG